MIFVCCFYWCVFLYYYYFSPLQLRARVEQLLNQQDLSLVALQKTLQLYTKMIGDGETDSETQKTKEVLNALATMITQDAE